jgi:hypothetical protein
MQHTIQWILIVTIMSSLLLAACKPVVSVASTDKPAQMEAIGDTGFNRLILTEDAVKRLTIETVPVSQEIITRKRIFGGQVGTLPGADPSDLSSALIEVEINEGDRARLIPSASGLVLPYLDDANVAQVHARSVEVPAVDDHASTQGRLYYQVDNSNQDFALGQRVRIEVPLEGDATQQRVIPYAGVIYDLQGNTWIYTNPEPFIFIRQPILIHYILGNWAVLTEGPAVGTPIVTAGAAELYGIEFGVGK